MWQINLPGNVESWNSSWIWMLAEIKQTPRRQVSAGQMLNTTNCCLSCFWHKYLVGWGAEEGQYACYSWTGVFLFILQVLMINYNTVGSFRLGTLYPIGTWTSSTQIGRRWRSSNLTLLKMVLGALLGFLTVGHLATQSSSRGQSLEWGVQLYDGWITRLKHNSKYIHVACLIFSVSTLGIYLLLYVRVPHFSQI